MLRTYTEYKLKDTIHSLYKRGLIYDPSVPTPINRKDILAEEIENEYSTGNYYFGLTPAGVELWEEASKEYSEPIDWSNSWTLRYDSKRQEGYIDGTSRDVCLNVLIERNQDKLGSFKDWQVAMNSLVDSKMDGFQATYYKHISGGHRISFKLIKR